jgi:4-diphosphocytidyl-2-C-methyl-D-erythritol kinase
MSASPTPLGPRIRFASATRVAGVAPAKLNLFLEVLARRADGYHDLATVFHEIDLADEIEVELRPRAEADSLSCEGLAIDGPLEENLALRAVAAFRRRVAAAPPLHVRLVKRVPLGSGMGGGSSDAAFVLRALQRMLASGSDDAALAAAARDVGADVGFFLRGGTAIGRGRGDELVAIEGARDFKFLLAMPRFSLSTARVYAHVDLNAPRADVSSFVEGMKERSRGEPVTGCFNRLEAAATCVEPRLAPLLEQLRGSTGADWHMTGSGSALFAPMRSAAEAELLARRVTGSLPLDSRIVRSFAAGTDATGL